MSELLLKLLLVTIVQLTLFSQSEAGGCNEAICASTVSKCMLLNTCKCDISTCSCCKECFLCLGYLYDECCACFDLCPNSFAYDDIPLSRKSHVEDFDEPFPELFRALTEEEDEHARWTSYTYPVTLPKQILTSQQEKQMKYYKLTGDQRYDHSKKLEPITANCSVAFLTECTQWSKCKQACQSIGATSYRWFHNGCCECIGESCINYGIKESQCENCPPKYDYDEEYNDYGQYSDEYYLIKEDL